jgi:hypothetical protein
MTGLLSRFRNWLGSLFGGDDGAGDADGTDEPSIEGGAPTVTHRDDRPLETPDVPPSTAESVPPSTTDDPSGEPTDLGDARDADPDAVATPEADSTPGPGPVTIPDAEATADADGEATTGPEATDTGTDAADPASGRPDGKGSDTAVTTDDASAFECAVCGTAVDDPAHSCPLCRSTEVVPATESSEGGS